MKWLLLEEFIPSSDKFVLKSIESDSERTRYTPTLKFLKRAYSALNNKFFNGELSIDGMQFKIGHDLSIKDAGWANADKDNDTGEIRVNYILLNGTLMKTPHAWIETLIHEMIHIEDFIHHPEHFIEGYTGHEDWFKKRARSFRKYGFNITETDMDKDVTTTIDDKDIKEKYENTIFIELGYNPVYEKMSILSIPKEKKEDALVELKRAGCRSVKILHTDNLSSARLKHISISEIGHDSHMLDDNQYNHVYGPFEEVETIDLTKLKIDENSERKVGHGQFRPFIVKVLPNGDINYTT